MFLDDFSEKPKNIFSLLSWEKVPSIICTIYSFFLKESSENVCYCNGKCCLYANSKIDKNDYYHALNNDYKNIPECQIEPYINKGYVLPHQPWR